MNDTTQTSRPKVVIIGAGFGGLSAAKALRHAHVDITIIDRRNYHLFQPLLYQVATADLSPADIAWPIRGIFSRQKNVTVLMAEATSVDQKKKVVRTSEKEVPFDYLIVASGATHSYFGNQAWEKYAPGLKKIVDATEIRRRILYAFERAELSQSHAEQERCMNFVIVGAGPTGVELAGAIAELAHHTLSKDFRNIRPQDAKVILVEGGPRVLSSFPEGLSNKALRSLNKLGVDVRLNTMVEDITKDGVQTSDGFIPTQAAIWGAGVQVDHMEKWLGAPTDRAGRVEVTSDLSIPGNANIFVIGDAAKVAWKENLSVPGIAPAAKQQGKYVASVIKSKLDCRDSSKPFQYKHFGNLATIGRNAAVIDFGWMKMSGFLAWWVWGFAHIYFLIDVRQPFLVATNWLWSYLTYSKGARLITGKIKLRR